ncbi:MAG TPA: hypothetical protein VKQ30_22615 [Ktedonobacterales bacterium]|nr:hypothetical protein [Ktedonobacterales bacterium]
MPLLSTNIRRTIAGFLGLALLAALWTTSLARLSDKPTSVALLTDAGTQLVNPLLVSNGTGITPTTYQQLERGAAAHPNQGVQILFIKPQILGSDIAGKSYTQGLQVIFGKVAEAYYAGGPGAAFSLPPQLQSVVGNFTPFTQLKTPISGIPQSPLPQLPSFVTPLFAHLGFTPTTLTADGHSAVMSLSLWFWIASGVLAALLALLGAGWARLSTIAWSVFHSSWHISLLLIIAAYLVSRNPTQAAPYRGVLGLVGGAIFPVYFGATIAGLLGVAACFAATHLPARHASVAREAAPVAAHVAARHPYMPSDTEPEHTAYTPQQPYPQQSWSQQPYPQSPAYPPTAPASPYPQSPAYLQSALQQPWPQQPWPRLPEAPDTAPHAPDAGFPPRS